MSNLPSHIALIGLGEVGGIFAEDFKAQGVKRLTAFDLQFDEPTSKASRAAERIGVEACASAAQAVKGAQLVVSAVTAAQAMKAAQSVAGRMDPGALFLDVNSASPGVKAAAAREIDADGGRYVEAAVMSSVPPRRLKSPMLLGGVHVRDFLAFAEPFGLDAKAYSETVGLASATKMCRSVMVKGVEALLGECLLAARHYGVEKAVLGSLSDMLPNPDWEKTARYMISRSLIHGKRRAEEMREVARTVKEAGVDPWMSSAAVERQEWAYAMAQELPPGAVDEPDLGRFLDAIRALIEAEA
jgi:3-hydroxyisobutyrate dehydrogenase-like beta-hydroxyacid dehydrogenase